MSRPPEKWYKQCKKANKGEVDNEYAVCQSIWKRISPSKQKRIRRRGEGFGASPVAGIGKGIGQGVGLALGLTGTWLILKTLGLVSSKA